MNAKEDIAKHYVTAMLCWPQVIGGPGALPLQTFIVRGENDMLAVSVSLIRHILRSYTAPRGLKRLMVNICSQKIRTGDRLHTLLKDPYALDIDCPERPGHFLEQFLKDVLRRVSVNRNLKLLLNRASDIDEQRLIKSLTSMRPFMPKLAAAIWGLS